MEEDPSPAPTRFRSVADYEDESSLRAALVEPPQRKHSAPSKMEGRSCTIDVKLSTFCCDWQTSKLDLSTSHPQSMEDEVKRLMELKEFAVLDSEHEEKFERIAALGSRIFDVPICLVSLVDIGRQWFMSNRGLGEVRETSRELSFCAHAIHSKEDIFVVPDTYDDPRFVNNGLVTGAPFIRFYAGVPLVTQRGYKLGSFCIIDRKPWPMGLSLNEKQNLRELTAMVMDTMVHRKQEMERLMDEKTRLIACAAHDLLSPLTGIKLNLGLLMEDEALTKKLDDNQRELMEACVKCSDVIERICVRAIESFRGKLTRTSASSPSPGEQNAEQGVVKIDQLIENISRVVGTFPKKVPFFIEKDDNVPQAIVSDDLKLFRSILNYLTNSCKQTHIGSIRLRIYVRKAGGSKEDNMDLDLLPGALVAPKMDVFVIEVHDTGPGIDLEKYPTLFKPLMKKSIHGTNEIRHSQMTNSGLGLYSVATEISSLGGEYGVFPRQDLVASHRGHDIGGMDVSSNHEHEPSITGCVFWLSVPLVLPATLPVTSSSSMDVIQKPSSGMTETDKREADAKTVTDDSNSMPAPVAVSMKRSYHPEAVITGYDDSSRVAKKQALRHCLTKDNGSTGNIASISSDVAIQQKRSKRVLIIDDSLTIRKGLSRGFSRLGFEVDEAENGLQGFKKLKASYFDIALLDFLMPVMDGPEVARKFRAWEQDHRPDFHQFIVGISAHANGKDAELGLKAGMDRFMGKPVPLKSLKDLAQCKPVMEASILLDMLSKKSSDAIEAAAKLAEAMSDEEKSKSSRSSVSSNVSSFMKHSALIAMQEEASLHSLQRVIDKGGWRTVVVNSGEDALRMLKLRKWEAVFIDNNLPVFSGTNCLIRFREWEKRTRAAQQKNVYFISDTYAACSPPSGFDGVLGKPVDPNQVVACLRPFDPRARVVEIRAT